MQKANGGKGMARDHVIPTRTSKFGLGGGDLCFA